MRAVTDEDTFWALIEESDRPGLTLMPMASRRALLLGLRPGSVSLIAEFAE
ncbi:hypothetical protein ACF09H_19225 [Streptomyces sp. NPDC014983]|uniref:hypothetical protein n=1 Tax=Streptomyces sp. NPDC014983 TaxID=3364933 RepID=UPI0036FD2B70